MPLLMMTIMMIDDGKYGGECNDGGRPTFPLRLPAHRQEEPCHEVNLLTINVKPILLLVIAKSFSIFHVVFFPSFCHPPTPPLFFAFPYKYCSKSFFDQILSQICNQVLHFIKNLFLSQGIKYQSKKYHDILPFVHLAK